MRRVAGNILLVSYICTSNLASPVQNAKHAVWHSEALRWWALGGLFGLNVVSFPAYIRAAQWPSGSRGRLTRLKE